MSILFCIGWYIVNGVSRSQLIFREVESLNVIIESYFVFTFFGVFLGKFVELVLIGILGCYFAGYVFSKGEQLALGTFWKLVIGVMLQFLLCCVTIQGFLIKSSGIEFNYYSGNYFFLQKLLFVKFFNFQLRQQ